MWSKLTGVLKSRVEHDPATASTSTIPSPQTRPTGQYLSLGRSQGSVLSDARSLPPASPPSSPSRHGRLGLFKRNSKAIKSDPNDSSSFWLPNPLQKRRSTVQMDAQADGSTTSLHPPANDDNSPRQSCETAIYRPQTPIDTQRLSMALGNGSGSVRSILRDRNTPGTGQSVRFFSRDAYRVISPDVSTTSPDNSANGTSEASFQQKVSHDSVNGTPSQFTDQGSSVFHSAAVTMGEANRPVTPRPTTPMSQFTPTSLSEDSRQQQTAYTDAQSLSSPGLHNLKSIIAPVPPPDNSDIFDMSAAGEHGVQAIPMAVEGATLQDGAIEVDDDDETDAIGRVTSPVLPGNVGKENIAPAHEPIRNQTVFAMPEANTSNPLLTSNTIVDKSKGKSLGRKAGEAIFNSLTNALSDNEPKSSTNPPRPSSSLGFHKIFNGNSSTPPAVGKIITMADRPSATTMNRSRSYNDHIFQRPSSVVQDSARTNRYADPNLPARPDSMIDTSAVMVYPPGFTPDCSPSKIGPGESRAGMPDPFHADARTYYTPDVGVPNSPPAKSEASNKVQHARSASTSGISTHSSNGSGMSRVPSYKSNASVSTTARSENDDMVLALRTQLTFHQELSAQYESDLSARDELVSVLSSQLSATKSELDSRTRGAKVARQKIVQLERAFHSLELAYHEMEDQVEQSRLENAERSVMDEASGEALRALHGVIAKLEKENEKLKADSTRMHSSTRERSMNVNGSGSVGVNETGMSADDAMNDRLRETQEERAAEEERHRVAELTWEEERGRLSAKVGELESLQAKLEAKESELEVLRKEVEAQWAGTERMNAKIDELLSENEALVDRANALETTNPNNDELRKQVEALKEEIAAMEARTNELEIGWTDGENKKMELEKELEEMWTMKEEITKERDELHEELASAQEQVEQIREALKVAEARLASSDRESQLSLDNIARLESIISERDAELNEYSEKYSTQAHELDETRDQLSALRREHSRITAEYERKLADIASRHEEAHHEAENAIRERATMKVELETIKQRFQSMEEDIEKARRQVHVLRQESADQEVKITQLKQQKERDEEDKLGLNIALDSKQQELELLKRKMNLTGTAGSTSTVTSHARRESAAFTTPMPSRPPSAQSEAGSKVTKGMDTTITARTALGRTSRANSVTSGGNGNVLPPSAIKIKAPRPSSSFVPPSSTARPRASLSSSVSSLASSTSLSRSVSAAPRVSTSQRRQSAILSRSLTSKDALSKGVAFESSSALSDSASSISEGKENTMPTPRASVLNSAAATGTKARRVSSYTPKLLPA